MKKLFTLAVLVVACSASFAFTKDMSATDIKSEVVTRAKEGQTLAQVIAAAKLAGLSATVIQQALNASMASFSGGLNAQGVFDALVTAYPDSVSDLLPATASGNAQNTNQTLGNGFSGFNSSSFGQSRAATVGGGGRQSVSGS